MMPQPNSAHVQEQVWQDSKWLLPGAILLVCTEQMLGCGIPQFCKKGQSVALAKVIKSIPGILAHQSGTGRASASVKFLDAAGWALAPQLVAQCRAVRRAMAGHPRARHPSITTALPMRPDRFSNAHGGDTRPDHALATELAACENGPQGRRSGGSFVVVQIGASFAFAGHVLNRLQERSLIAANENGPFAGKLFANEHGASDSKLRNPRWQDCPTARKWMHPKLEMMDFAQKEAWKHALSARVALIQGLPGTGKTTTGVAVVRALLADPTCIVLLAAHSNQAVDQFLEGVLDSGVPESTVLRLGGFSSSERMQSSLCMSSVAAANKSGTKRNPRLRGLP
eukprot:jgi/Ulvmu1/4336/UM002_0059.1